MSSKQKIQTIRYVVFGSTGVGKSTLGNVLLGTNAFNTSDSFESCTKEPFSHSNTVNGVKIIVTDTVSLNDPEFDDEKKLKDLTSYFQNDSQGPINYFLICQKFTERFSYDMIKNIYMLLTSFVGPAPTENIKIVLTHAKGTPEQQKEKIFHMRYVISYVFGDFPPEIREQVEKIPILTINNHPKLAKRTPLPSDINPFQPNPAPSIDPHHFSPQDDYYLTQQIKEWIRPLER